MGPWQFNNVFSMAAEYGKNTKTATDGTNGHAWDRNRL
ncbi:MAG: hypothetical protein H6Q74_2222 [Firmicutes bacterium]|nr:hypothetical protein [Bacillota bacterium]